MKVPMVGCLLFVILCGCERREQFVVRNASMIAAEDCDRYDGIYLGICRHQIVAGKGFVLAIRKVEREYVEKITIAVSNGCKVDSMKVDVYSKHDIVSGFRRQFGGLLLSNLKCGGNGDYYSINGKVKYVLAPCDFFQNAIVDSQEVDFAGQTRNVRDLSLWEGGKTDKLLESSLPYF